MINLETPRKFRPLVNQAHQVALRCCGRTRAATTSPSTPTRRSSTCSRPWSTASRHSGTGPAPVRRGVTTYRGDADDDGHGGNRTAPTCPRCCPSWRCAGATSACCCRCRGRGSATPRSRRSPTRRAARALQGRLGGDGDHRAGVRLGLGRTIRTTARLDGDDYVINGEKIFVTAGDRCDAVVVWATLDRDLGRAAIKSFVVPKDTPGMTSNGSSTSSASARRTRRPSASRTAGCPRRTCSATRRSIRTRASRASCRPSTTPGRWSPRWRSAAPGPRWSSPASCSTEAGVEIDYDRPAQLAVRPPPPPSCSSRPTGRPPTC